RGVRRRHLQLGVADGFVRVVVCHRRSVDMTDGDREGHRAGRVDAAVRGTAVVLQEDADGGGASVVRDRREGEHARRRDCRLYAALSPALTLLPGVNDGASLTGLTVMVNVCGAEVSTPPFAVPPLSCSVTVTVAVPLASGAGVKVRTPLGEIDGCDEKSALLS